MISAHAFQHVLAVVRQWWHAGLMVNARFALIDDPQSQLLRYYSVYASKVEAQRRGALQFHVMIQQFQHPICSRYVEICRAGTARHSLADIGTTDEPTEID
jgi:hypothetical protein